MIVWITWCVAALISVTAFAVQLATQICGPATRRDSGPVGTVIVLPVVSGSVVVVVDVEGMLEMFGATEIVTCSLESAPDRFKLASQRVTTTYIVVAESFAGTSNV